MYRYNSILKFSKIHLLTFFLLISISINLSFAIQSVSEVAGYALDFDGVDDYIRIPDSPSFSFNTTLTVEVWFNARTISNLHGHIINKDNGYINVREFDLDLTAHLQFTVFSNPVTFDYARDGDPSTNIWHHIAGVYDGSSIHLYLDGNEVSSTAHTGSIPDTDLPITIGNANAVDRPFDGIIDEVRIWNIARSQSEIQSSMNCILSGNEEGLVGYWRLDEGTGQTTNDASGNGNHGQLGSTSGIDNNDPTWLISDSPLTGNCDLETVNPNDWPMMFHDPTHSGFSPDTVLTPPLVQKWKFESGHGASSLGISNIGDRVYVTGMGEHVYSLDTATGSIIWDYTGNGEFNNFPAFSDGILYAGARDGKLYAINTSDGTLISIYTTGNAVRGGAVVSNGIVYFTSFDGNIYAASTSSLSPIWNRYISDGDIIESAPAIENGVVYVGGGNYIWALDASSGTTRWNKNLVSTVHNSPAIKNGMVLTASQTVIYALNTSNGSTVWNKTVGSISNFVISGDTVFFGSGSKIYSLVLSTGSTIWQKDLSSGFSSYIIGANGYLYTATGSAGGYAILQMSDGSIFDEVSGQPYPHSISGGIFYIGNTLGHLYAYVPQNSSIDSPPNAPTNLVAIAGNNQVQLTWNANTESDLAGYNLYRRTSSTSFNKINSFLIDSTSYLDISVTNGTTYYYVVRAVDTSNQESIDSNEVNIILSSLTISWKFTSPFSYTRSGGFSVIYKNGFVYAFGGGTTTLYYTPDVHRSQIQSDGSLSPWENLSGLDIPLGRLGAVVVGDYVYLVGGSETYYTEELRTVRRAKIYSDGSLGTWTIESNQLNTGRVDHSVVYSNGYIYAIGGGANFLRLNSVEYAPVNPDGSIGVWQYTQSLNYSRWINVSVSSNGFIYCLGGNSNTRKAEYSQVLSNGDLTAWQLTGNNMPSCWTGPGLAVIDNTIYAFGGWDSNDYETRDMVMVNINTTDGSLQSWINTGILLNQERGGMPGLAINKVLYAFGGHENIGEFSVISTVEYLNLNINIISPPNGLIAISGNGKVQLSWNANTESDLAGYNLYRRTSGTSFNKINTFLIDSTSYLDISVTNGTTYYYVVRAVDTSNQESGNSNEVSSMPLSPPSDSGNALHFDSMDDYVLVTDSPTLVFNTTLTIEAWIKPYDISFPRGIVNKDDTGTRREINLGYLDNGKLNFHLFTSPTQFDTAKGGQLINGIWQHIAAVYDGSSMYLYLNGTLATSTAHSGNIVNTNVPLTIGNWFIADRSFNGVMDEVRLWNIAKSQSEIQSTINCLLSGNEEGLVGYWRLDEGTGQSTNDASVYGNHGQLGSTYSTDSNDPTWTISNASLGICTTIPPYDAGYALDFDAINDVVEIPDSPSLSMSTSITVEAWIFARSISNLHGNIIEKTDPPTDREEFSFGLTDHLQFVVTDTVQHWDYARDGYPALTTWQHVAGTYDGSSIRVYLNGNEVASKSHSGPMPDSNVHITIGNSFFIDRPFDGLIDEVRVWNIVRNQSDIQSNMNCILSGNEFGLVGYWRFDEGSGQTVNDASGHGNHGKLGISIEQDSNDPKWVTSNAPIEDCIFNIPPSSPTGLIATASNGQLNASVQLSWSANTETDLAGYNVYRRQNGTFQKINVSIVAGTNYNDITVLNETTYYYVVRAQDTSGLESGNSNEVSALPHLFLLEFYVSSDTIRLAYELPPTGSLEKSKPVVGWLPNYSNQSGILKLSFSQLTQGLKMTLESVEWLSSASSKWYTVKVKVKSDIPAPNTLHSLGFLYNGVPPDPTDIGGHVVLSTPTSWFTLQAYLYSVGGNQFYPQWLIRNNSTITASVYIDYVQILETIEPSVDTAFFEGSDFDSFNDLDHWGLEIGPEVGSMPLVTTSTGKLILTFNGQTSQGLKMTMANSTGGTYTIPTQFNKLSGIQSSLCYSTSTNIDSYIVLAVFGTNSVNGLNFLDIGFSSRINRLYEGDNGIVKALYFPQQSYFYGQVLVKNGVSSKIYLDNVHPIIESDFMIFFTKSFYPMYHQNKIFKEHYEYYYNKYIVE